MDDTIKEVEDKIYSRDLFSRDYNKENKMLKNILFFVCV